MRKENRMSMNKSNNGNAPTIVGHVVSFIAAITQVVFLVLKLCGIISWDWVWVMAPSWTITCFSNCMLFLMTVIKGFVALNVPIDKKNE